VKPLNNEDHTVSSFVSGEISVLGNVVQGGEITQKRVGGNWKSGGEIDQKGAVEPAAVGLKGWTGGVAGGGCRHFGERMQKTKPKGRGKKRKDD